MDTADIGLGEREIDETADRRRALGEVVRAVRVGLAGDDRDLVRDGPRRRRGHRDRDDHVCADRQ